MYLMFLQAELTGNSFKTLSLLLSVDEYLILNNVHMVLQLHIFHKRDSLQIITCFCEMLHLQYNVLGFITGVCRQISVIVVFPQCFSSSVNQCRILVLSIVNLLIRNPGDPTQPAVPVSFYIYNIYI